MEVHRLAHPGVSKIQPYVPGTPIEVIAKKRGMDPDFYIKLASNENLMGSAPHALQAMISSIQAKGVNYYPECSCAEVVQALGGQIGLPQERILMVNSSNEGINYVSRAFLGKGNEIVMSQIAFPMYPIAAHYQDAQVVRVPNKGWHHDMEAILAAITPNTRLVWLDTPNNPLGTIVSQSEMDTYFERVPNHVITVIDEAYDQYVESSDYPDSRVYQEKFQAIVLRTFSKIYGLAGLRVGYLFAAPDIIETLHRVHAPFYMPDFLQAALYAAITQDQAFVTKTQEMNREGKKYLYAALEHLEISYVPTEANFIFYPIKEEMSTPAQVYERFFDFGIIVRPIGNLGIRVTIGLPEQNERFISALEEIHREGMI